MQSTKKSSRAPRKKQPATAKKQPALAKEAPRVVLVEGDVDDPRSFEETLNRNSDDYKLVSVVKSGYKLLGFLAKQ